MEVERAFERIQEAQRINESLEDPPHSDVSSVSTSELFALIGNNEEANNFELEKITNEIESQIAEIGKPNFTRQNY